MTVLGDREVGGASLPSQATVLTGFSVAITACRRREELAGLLERRGARVISAPAVQIRPLTDDTDLVAATRACIAAPPAIVIASTGVGFRGWMEAADGWGLGDALRRVLDAANVLARGPKAMGAIRAAGLRESWSPVSESLREVLDHLRAGDIRGVRIAVQLHGDPEPELIEGLLRDPDLQNQDLVVTPAPGAWVGEGVGVVEAPRGTLLHHYRAGAEGDVTFANLIVATTHNNSVLNRTVRAVAEDYLVGRGEITESMMNAIEVGIRAFDPCLSCATHAFGQMPLMVTVHDPAGNVIDERVR